jgi:RNA polymerase sigma-70 factor (ECF subfamily)
MMLRFASRSPQRALADRQWPQESAADQAASIRAGDEQAFAALFLAHYDSLCEFVDSYLHAPDMAEEVVQSVFLRIWENRDSWDPRGSARAFLFASCRNHALDLLRHEQIVARSAEEHADLGLGRWSVARMADADLEAAELADRLRIVVAGLPERRRLVVVLRWQHQLSNGEIARILGISVKGVEIQFSRALADLRRQLGELVRDLV